jgi:hypothetical protein
MTSRRVARLAFCAALVQVTASGQTRAVKALVGGTLIDGNDSRPLQNSVVIVEGDRIRAVGRVGSLAGRRHQANRSGRDASGGSAGGRGRGVQGRQAGRRARAPARGDPSRAGGRRRLPRADGLATAQEYPPDIIAMIGERTAKMSLGPLWWTPTTEGLLN